ncbi:phosphatidate cytidylyltransferase [Clostridium tunisiense]|uniref:phosphatidate cytidylyltransferase n=1 Tax=Clostridium tunisiense TaxID=219748 RepID=UPI00030B017D|nr:phosphatidate cytidylyltransferase [Clostridium tunisiense]
MDKRYIGAITLAPLLIFLFLGGYYLKYLVLVLALFGMYEFYKTSRECDFNPISIVGYILCILYYLAIGDGFNITYQSFLLIGAIFILMIVPVLNTKYNFIDVSLTIMGYLYVAIFFSFIILVNLKQYGNYLVWLIFISSWGCDTLAYYFGRYLGKHKISPKVSPKKTVEGSIGGLIGSIVGCTIFGYVIGGYGVNIPIYHYVIIGVLGGIFGQFGDLVASSIKRYAKVKDYSNLIPGHGGILDRFDSILFVSVIVYYYITIFVGI